MTTTTIAATLSTGKAANVRALLTNPATRPAKMLVALHPDTTRPFAVRKGLRLLDNGYRFSRRDGESLYCHTPGGDVYTVNLATGRCSCRATGLCSHMVSARRITHVMAHHPCQPEPEWFDHECRECYAPSWSYVQTGSYGRSWSVAVCPRGCECYRMEEPRSQVLWDVPPDAQEVA